MDIHTPQLTTEMHRQIKDVHSKGNLSSDREKLLDGLLWVISWRTIKEDEYILLECLRETCKELGIDVEIDEQFISELKTRYFKRFCEILERKIKAKKEEILSTVPTKQLYYLAATVFAESILSRPTPASLIFEILRCAGMEEEKNFPNRYYFLRQLEEKGLIKKITVVNSKAEQLYCSTEEGKKIVNGTDAFNKLIELRKTILNDTEVKKLIELYSKEDIKIKKELPKLLLTSQIISENDNVVRVSLYGREVINLSKEEIEKIDSIAKELGRFKQSDLRRLANSRTKAQAYLVYAYDKGWIDVIGKDIRGREDSFIFERKMV